MTTYKESVLLSCPTMRGVLEALALEAGGYSVQFVTSLCFWDLSWIPSVSPFRSLRKLFERRLHPDLALVDVTRIWWPEVMLAMLERLQLGDRSKRLKLFNEAFDWAVANRNVDYDVLHFVNSTGLLAARKAKRTQARIVLSQRDVHPKYEMELLQTELQVLNIDYMYHGYSFADRMYEEFELADAIIVQSTYSAKTFAEHGYGSKVHTINFSYNRRHFKMLPKRETVPFRVLFVGSITPLKGVHYLVEAFEKAALPNAELWLVGSVHPAMKDRISSLPGSVYHFAHMSQSELATIYSQASVFVLPTLTDAWGFVVLEAMASGLPVIVTENTGAKDAVRSGVDGFVVPIRDSDSIADYLTRLYHDPNLRRDMGLSANHRCKDFTWEAYFKRFAEVYGQILEQVTS